MKRYNIPIDINARFFMKAGHGGHCVYDRLKGDKHVFCNGSELECREWVKRNYEEPKPHWKAPWTATEPDENGTIAIKDATRSLIGVLPSIKPIGANKQNAALIVTAPKLLALLKRYQEVMPTPDGAKLILEAEGWNP